MTKQLKPDQLGDALARSFAVTPPEPEEKKPPVEDKPQIPKSTPKKPIPAPKLGGGARKSTVTFYNTEKAKIDLILEHLRKERDFHGGFSDAIKIALRLCPDNGPKIAAAWDEARAEDGRVTRHKKTD